MTNIAPEFQQDLNSMMAMAESSMLKGTRWIVRMETVPGAGEWINTIVVLRMDNGECSVHPMLSDADLNRIFTPLHGRGIAEMVTHTVTALKKQLAESLDPRSVEMPFGCFAISEGQELTVKSVEEGLRQTTRLSSGLAIPDGEKLKLMQLDDERKNAEWAKVFDRWNSKSLRPGISREQFESALQIGFAAAWDAKR